MNLAFVYFAISWSAIQTFAVPSKDTTVIKIRSQYKPQYPIYLSEDGIYDEIFSGDMIVDKSLFMEKIIKSPHKVFLITGPQRFGKSVNLDMAGRFFELLDCWRDEYEQETSEGTIIPRENTTSFELFHNGTLKERFKELEEPLLVSRNKDMLENHQGRYPVIYLPMYSRAICYETFLNGMIKYHIEQVCKKYEPVIRNAYFHKIEANLSDYATRDRLYKFERYREVSTVNETDLIESVQFLSKLLKDQFNKPPIVIMDGYDFLPTRVLLDNTFEGRRELLEFFKKFFQTTLQDRSLYSKLIISGTLKMKSSIFAGIEDIHDINLLKENEFTPFFGFLREEVDAVFKIAGVSDEFQQKAHDYYNGYKIGNHIIYSPPSIIQCLRKKKVDNFWADEYLSKYFFETVLAFKEIRNEFFNFVHGHPKEINLEDLDITEAEYMGLVTGNHTGFDLVRTVLKIATAKGYFSIKQVSKDGDKIYFPNKELWSTTRAGLIKNLREIPSLIPGYDWEVSDERQDEGELKHFTSLSEELVKFFNNRETTSAKIDELFELNLNNATLKKLIKNKVLVHDIILYAFLFIENHKKIEHKLNITVVDREAPDANLPYIVAHNNDHGVLLEVIGKKGEPLPEDFHRKHKFPIKTLKYITIDVFRNKTTCVTGQYFDATKLYA